MSATCPSCQKEMNPGNGCEAKHLHVENGEEDYSLDRTPYFPMLIHGKDTVCHDCNVSSGQIHHPNCDMEKCPMCGGQLISCDCPIAAYIP